MNLTTASTEVVLGNSVSHKVISSIAILILIILTVFGNALVIFAFYAFKQIRRSVTNWFIVSLAVSDLLVAFTTEPIWLAGEITNWIYPPEINVNIFGQVWTMIDIVCAISSISNLMFISIDRYFAIKSPLIHHTKMTTDKCKWIIMALWIHAFGTSCLFLLNWHWKYLAIFTFGFVIPVCIMMFCYAGILTVVSSRTRVPNRHGRRAAREYKTAKSLGVVTGAFVLCWLPFFVTSLAYQYCVSCQINIDKIPAATSAVKWLHYLNSCLNPIIYAFLNPTFKLAFRNLIRRMLGRETRNVTELETSVSTFSFRRRGTKGSLVRRQNNGQFNTKYVSNGNVSCQKDPLLQHGNKTSVNKGGPRESISDDGSVERGIETPEEGNSTCGQPWPNMDLRCKRIFRRDKSVSFTDEVGICCEIPSVIDTNTTDRASFDVDMMEGHLSTYYDKVNNHTYLFVDGVLIPEGEIKSSDV